jgi:SAM-dependent methyltransferase
MLALATEHLTPGSVVLDVGCRDDCHLIQLVRATGASGVGIDPLSRFVERARDAVARRRPRRPNSDRRRRDAGHPVARRVLRSCVVHDSSRSSRPSKPRFAEVARVLRPGGHLVVFTVFASNRLEPKEPRCCSARTWRCVRRTSSRKMSKPRSAARLSALGEAGANHLRVAQGTLIPTARASSSALERSLLYSHPSRRSNKERRCAQRSCPSRRPV